MSFAVYDDDVTIGIITHKCISAIDRHVALSKNSDILEGAVLGGTKEATLQNSGFMSAVTNLV